MVSFHHQVRFKKKLQLLKSNLWVWNAISQVHMGNKRKEIQETLDSIDYQLMDGDGTTDLQESS